VLSEQMSLYAKTRNQIGVRLVESRLLMDSLDAACRNSYLADLDSIYEFCHNHNIKLILCTFPTKVTHNNDFIDIEKSVRFCYKSNFILSTNGWVNTVDTWNQELRHYATVKDLPLIELAAPLSGHIEYFRDFVHLSPQGHSAVAMILTAEMKKYLSL
jgi:hypothetical protein